MTKIGLAGAALCALASTAQFASGDDLLRLWGVDADDAQIFAIDDLRNPHATLKSYGRLHVASGQRAEPVTTPVRALTVVNTFDAYAVIGEDIAGFDAPVLVHFDLRDLDDALPVTADAIGTLDLASAGGEWEVTGIAGDPLYNVMHVLISDSDGRTNDRVVRIRQTLKNGPETEHISELRWQHGGVRQGGDIALGPAGLLLISDEAEGRVVLVEPTTGEIRGVRLEGVRVDTDAARYGGLAWDGMNDRTALFDGATGQLIVSNRRDNSIAAFDMTQAGIDNAEGLEFVYRPDPPGEGAEAGASSAIGGVSNVANRGGYGSNRGARGSKGGGGGGSSGTPFDFSDLFDGLDDEPIEVDDPLDGPGTGPASGSGGGSSGGSDDPFDNPGDDAFDEDPIDNPGGDEEDPGGGGGGGDPGGGGGGGGGGSTIPTPGGIALIGLTAAAVARRRR